MLVFVLIDIDSCNLETYALVAGFMGVWRVGVGCVGSPLGWYPLLAGGGMRHVSAAAAVVVVISLLFPHAFICSRCRLLAWRSLLHLLLWCLDALVFLYARE